MWPLQEAAVQALKELRGTRIDLEYQKNYLRIYLISMNLFNEVEWNEFRAKHPEMRFWQAMASYLYVKRILVEYHGDQEMIYEDTFFWQDDK